MLSHIIYFEKFSKEVFKNDYSKKQFDTIKKYGKDIQIAAIGTSHTGDGFLTDNSNFFNYGRQSTYFPQVGYAKASHLMEYSPNIQSLILEVDHISIFGYDSKLKILMPENHSYLLKNVTNTLYSKKNKDINNKPFLISLQKDVAPIIHRKFIQEYLIKRGQNNKSNHNLWSKLPKEERRLSAQKRVESNKLHHELEIDKAVYDYYKEIIIEAKRRGIKIYLILIPQTSEYLNHINISNNKKLNDFISILSTDKNVKGSLQFTKIVLKEIQKDLIVKGIQ